jgi:hypothetical protein
MNYFPLFHNSCCELSSNLNYNYDINFRMEGVHNCLPIVVERTELTPGPGVHL